MRFNKLQYLHTDKFDDIHEIKFVGNFEKDVENVLTVEVWVQDENVEVVIVDNSINSTVKQNFCNKKYL